MLLNNKVAVITGAGSGMGRASAVLFAKEGASVVVAELNMPGAEETVQIIKGNGGKAIAVKTDVSDEEQVKSLIAAAVTEYGKIDILFCAAGMPEVAQGISGVSLAHGKKVFDINVLGTWLCCKYAYPELKKTGKGVILTVGSAAAIRPRGGTALYSASKGAVISLTKALANEFAPEIRVNCILPGATDTPMMNQFVPGFNEDIKNSIANGLPLKRFSQPEEIAELGLFLASDKALSITGVEWLIDNGFSISRGKE